jgi:hypothetical protein
VKYNLTDFHLDNFHLDPDTPIMDLVGNDEFKIQWKDFSGHISGNYMFITDPPILADIGAIDF